MTNDGYRYGGKSSLMAIHRDVALARGKTVAVANLVNGEVHFCIVKPFRPKPTPANRSGE